MSEAPEKNDPADAERKRLQNVYLATGASIVLVYASFHPIDFGLAAYFALVPWLFTALRETRRVAITTSYVATFLWHVLGLSWIALVTAPGWIATSFLEGFYSVAIVLLVRWMRRTTSLPVSVLFPPLWVAGEYHRGAHLGFIKFPWLLMGHTQHARSTLIQIADVTSVYGLSFLVVLVNAFIVDALLLWDERRRAQKDLDEADRKRLLKLAACPAALLLLANVYGLARTAHVESNLVEGPRVLAIQGDFPMDVNGTSAVPAVDQVRRQFELTMVGLGSAGQTTPDAIIWPETAWVWPLNYEHPDYSKWDPLWGVAYDRLHARNVRYPDGQLVKSYDRQLFSLARQNKCDVLLGVFDNGRFETNRFVEGRLFPQPTPENRIHNSFYQIGLRADGEAVVKARYDKINLVPASEGIPFQDPGSSMHWFFKLVKSFVPEGFDVFEEGKGPVVMELSRPPHWRISPDICFEVSFPELIRRGVVPQKQPDGTETPGADVLVCPSNDGWFHTQDNVASPEIPLAFDHAQLRAIETRRGMLRVVNRGITCVIDPLGRMKNAVEGAERRRDGTIIPGSKVHVEGYLLETVPTTRLSSFYLRFGDAAAWLSVLASASLIGFSWMRGRRGPGTPPA